MSESGRLHAAVPLRVLNETATLIVATLCSPGTYHTVLSLRFSMISVSEYLVDHALQCMPRCI